MSPHANDLSGLEGQSRDTPKPVERPWWELDEPLAEVRVVKSYPLRCLLSKQGDTLMLRNEIGSIMRDCLLQDPTKSWEQLANIAHDALFGDEPMQTHNLVAFLDAFVAVAKDNFLREIHASLPNSTKGTPGHDTRILSNTATIVASTPSESFEAPVARECRCTLARLTLEHATLNPDECLARYKELEEVRQSDAEGARWFDFVEFGAATVEEIGQYFNLTCSAVAKRIDIIVAVLLSRQ